MGDGGAEAAGEVGEAGGDGPPAGSHFSFGDRGEKRGRRVWVFLRGFSLDERFGFYG